MAYYLLYKGNVGQDITAALARSNKDMGIDGWCELENPGLNMPLYGVKKLEKEDIIGGL